MNEFNECQVSVSPDGYTIIARGKFRRDLQIKGAYFFPYTNQKLKLDMKN